jgi:hypothetical protein
MSLHFVSLLEDAQLDYTTLAQRIGLLSPVTGTPPADTSNNYQ